MDKVTPLAIGVNIYRVETRFGNVYAANANNLDEAETLVDEYLRGINTGDFIVKTRMAIKGGNTSWD